MEHLRFAGALIFSSSVKRRPNMETKDGEELTQEEKFAEDVRKYQTIATALNKYGKVALELFRYLYAAQFTTAKTFKIL
jgi:hypothetical protein